MRPEYGQMMVSGAVIPPPASAPPPPPPPSSGLPNPLEGVRSATIIKPGDRVLLIATGNWTRERADRAMHALTDRFPDAEFTFVDGIAEVVVKRAAHRDEGSAPDG